MNNKEKQKKTGYSNSRKDKLKEALRANLQRRKQGAESTKKHGL